MLSARAFVVLCAPALFSCTPAASPSSPRGESEPTVDEESPEALPPAEEPGGDDAAQGPHPLADDREPDPSRALPQLTYTHLGMHIGGESNSPEAKRPWLDAIERHEDVLLSCYRLVDKPERGGSYGVDLYIGKGGGAPEVRGSRQKIGGDEFDRCMRDAFGSIDFHTPERPTVLSYSILFKLGQ